jgi:hypothetical protein
MHPTHTGYPQFKCKTNGHIYMDYRQIMMQMQMPWLIASLSLSLFFFQERQIKKMIRIMACVRHCFHMAASLVALLITIENLNRNERSQVTSAPWRRGVLCNFLSACSFLTSTVLCSMALRMMATCMAVGRGQTFALVR